MKKIFVFLFVFLMFLSGCSKINSTDSKSNGSGNQNIFEEPADKADLVGMVESIAGNEVTILKIEMNNSNQEFPEGVNSEEASTNESKTEGNKTLSLTGTGTMGGGGMGMMGGGRPEDFDSSNSKSDMLSRIKEMSSGSETVIIPVGIEMLKMDTTTREMVEANLTDIATNQMLSIWLNDEITDRNIAKFVIIK